VSAYYIDEGVFELPAGLDYLDRSVNIIEAPGPDGHAEFGLLVERRPIAPGKSLADVVSELRAEQATRLRGHVPVGAGERTVGGLFAMETRLRWRHQRGPVYHFQVHVPLGVTCLTMTASSRHERADACNAWMEALLSTLRFRPR
jgi:hypothetical protein